MMTLHGQEPGQVTPKDEAPGAINTEGLDTHTNKADFRTIARHSKAISGDVIATKNRGAHEIS